MLIGARKGSTFIRDGFSEVLPPLENLRFGTTARRKARRQRRRRRIALTIWALSTAGVLAGTPVARTTAVNLLEGFAVQQTGNPSAQAGATSPGSVVSDTSRPTEPAPAVTLGHSDKKKLPAFVARQRRERRADAAEASGGSVVGIIHAAAAEFGVEGDYLVSIAECESGLDPRAYNPAGYHGLFQYDDTTWSAYGYGSIWDPVAQARTTAELIAEGGSGHWPNCA